MSVLFYVEHSDLFLKFPESFIFYTNMAFKIQNIVVKCSRTFFLKAPMRPLLKQNFCRLSNFHAEYKTLNTLAGQGML